jgi:hypothetical protein
MLGHVYWVFRKDRMGSRGFSIPRSRRQRRSRVRTVGVAALLVAVGGMGAFWMLRGSGRTMAATAKEAARGNIADLDSINHSVQTVELHELAPGNADDSPSIANGDGEPNSQQRVYLSDPIEPELADVTPTRVKLSDTMLARLQARAKGAMERSDLLTARESLNTALAGMARDDVDAPGIMDQLASLNAPVFLGTDLWADDRRAGLATVRAGDTLAKIAQRVRLPLGLIRMFNPNLNERRMKTLSGIKVVNGPFYARICKAEGRVELYCRDLFVAGYRMEMQNELLCPSGLYRVAAVRGLPTTAPARYDIGNDAGTIISLQSTAHLHEAAIELSIGRAGIGNTGSGRASRRAAQAAFQLDAAAWPVGAALLPGTSLVQIEP